VAGFIADEPEHDGCDGAGGGYRGGEEEDRAVRVDRGGLKDAAFVAAEEMLDVAAGHSNQPKEPCTSAKEPCITSKTPCISGKEPCTSAIEPCPSIKNPCITAKKPRVCAKEPCVYAIQGSPTTTASSAEGGGRGGVKGGVWGRGDREGEWRTKGTRYMGRGILRLVMDGGKTDIAWGRVVGWLPAHQANFRSAATSKILVLNTHSHTHTQTHIHTHTHTHTNTHKYTNTHKL